MRRLTKPVHSVALKHHKYCGRIVWDATDPEGILFTVSLAKKDIDHAEVEDIGATQLIVATLNFSRLHEEFDNNFYHPDFSKEVQKHIRDLLKEDQMLKKQLEKVLKG